MEGELARSKARLPSLLLALLGLGPGECMGGRHPAAVPRVAGGWRWGGLRAGMPTPSRLLPARWGLIPTRPDASPPTTILQPSVLPGWFWATLVSSGPALTRGFVTRQWPSNCRCHPPPSTGSIPL